MKSISKAMIAVMIAAAMCVVPLFVIEDSDAVTITTGGKAASFEAGSVSNDDFNKIASADYKQYLCGQALAAFFGSSYPGDFAISEYSVTDVSDVKLSKGTDINDDNMKNVDAMKITFKAKFKATYSQGYSLTTPDFYSTVDGTQDIYKELGTNKVTDGTILTIDGTFTIEKTEITTTNFEKTNAGALAIKESVSKNSQIAKFDGTVGFNNGVVNKSVTMKTENSLSLEAKTTYDYYGVNDVKDVVAGTKAFRMVELQAGGIKSSADMKVGDVSGGYSEEYGKDMYVAIMAFMASYVGGTIYGYTAGTADSLSALINADIVAPDYYFVTDDGLLYEDYSLFYAPLVQDDSLKTNDGMKSFLEKIGSASTEFSSADNVANAAFENVNVGGSGGNNIIFYVIIGVLAVAVVALAVLLIKKK